MLISMTLCIQALVGLNTAEMTAILTEIDNRQRNSGDYAAVTYIEQKEAGKTDLVYEAVIYRRDVEDKLMILFTKPNIKFINRFF